MRSGGVVPRSRQNCWNDRASAIVYIFVDLLQTPRHNGTGNIENKIVKSKLKCFGAGDIESSQHTGKSPCVLMTKPFFRLE